MPIATAIPIEIDHQVDPIDVDVLIAPAALSRRLNAGQLVVLRKTTAKPSGVALIQDSVGWLAAFPVNGSWREVGASKS